MNFLAYPKRLIFYWITSFVLASLLYYILWFIMPNHYVFGMLFRRFLYHYEHPIIFILIPCFFYGILATIFSNKLFKQNKKEQILTTLKIQFLTILFSCPFGGMLWVYFDMVAGYFPENWILKIMNLGLQLGLNYGWFIIILSVPYNIIASIGCFLLTKKGAQLFQQKLNTIQ